MKYLLQAIEANREAVNLSDEALKSLLIAARSGKDDRIEFIESMTRLVDELRSSEHAAAFLTKVAKRDAPDYYDVIKNPMDLGTMLRNVKNGRYKSKAQFMRDLDLIWDNCLTYNSEPTHPLRRSVQIMRNKANHLLTYVNDTNDVKEALSLWQPSSSRYGSTSNRDSEVPMAAGQFRSEASMQGLNGVSNATTSINRRSISMNLKRVNVALSEAPFEQRPAFLRTMEGMDTFDSIDAALSKTDEHFQKGFLPLPSSSEAGPSRKTIDTFDLEPAGSGGLTASASGDLLRTLEASSSMGGVLRNALTQNTLEEGEEGESSSGSSRPALTNGHVNGALTKKDKKTDPVEIPYPLDIKASVDGIRSDQYQLGAWWNSTSHSSLLANGIPPSSTSVQRGGSIPSRLVKIPLPEKRRKTVGQDKSKNAFGGLQLLEKNVSTVSKLRKTHAKFGALTSHIENEEPIPAALAVVSSDESDGEGREKEEEEEGVAGGGGKKAKRSHEQMDITTTSMHDSQHNPYPKLNNLGATQILNSKTKFMLAHAGFEGSQRSAASVMTDVASEYLMNLGRTFRMYMDNFSREMSIEEIILHVLFENGGMDVRNLESYIVDDVIRRGAKLSDLLRKLQSSYRDKLNNTNLTMEDEAYFAENAEGNNDQIMSGGFAQDMGDDFFGFKEMGLDKELGLDMSQLMVPSKLFNKGAGGPSSSSANQGRGGGAMGVGSRVGGGGIVGGGAGLAAGGLVKGGVGSGAGGEVIMFEPPPPYVSINESSIGAQIGLLQPFFRELMRTRGQWQSKPSSSRRRYGGDEGEEDDDDNGDEEEDEEEEEGRDGDDQDEEGSRKRRRKDRGHLVLPEEEMERQRYKVPPNGRMPKRAMKVKGESEKGRLHPNTTQASATTAASATATSTSNSEKTKSGSTGKKKKKESATS